jgi:hypothetical protein
MADLKCKKSKGTSLQSVAAIVLYNDRCGTKRRGTIGRDEQDFAGLEMPVLGK